jgi:hypothetical protein
VIDRSGIGKIAGLLLMLLLLQLLRAAGQG